MLISKMTIFQAIFQQLSDRLFLTSLVTVLNGCAGDVDQYTTISQAVISTSDSTIKRDASPAVPNHTLYKYPLHDLETALHLIIQSAILYPAGIVHGRIVEGRLFQFIFPTDESLETVLRRGPWACNDRMLILQRWTPQMSLLNFIPFWIQVRGIPYQFLNRGVVEHIGRSLGQVLEVDFDVEAVARMDFFRVHIHWDITHPFRFQRNFQFSDGVNTLLRFRYERLLGFCEVCRMLTHESGACLIQNGGEEENDNDEDDDQPQERVPNQGVIIREHNEEEAMEMDNNQVNNVVIADVVPRQNGDNEITHPPRSGSNEDSLSDIDPNHDSLVDFEHYDMFSGERNDSELLNPIPIFENSCGDIPGSPSNRVYSRSILWLSWIRRLS